MELQMLGFSATITTSLPPPPAICEGTLRDSLYEREKEDEKEEDEMEDGVVRQVWLLRHCCLLPLEPTKCGTVVVPSCVWLCETK